MIGLSQQTFGMAKPAGGGGLVFDGTLTADSETRL